MNLASLLGQYYCRDFIVIIFEIYPLDSIVIIEFIARHQSGTLQLAGPA